MESKEFQKVVRMAEIIEKNAHNDTEIDEITEYLREFSAFKKQLNILSKIQIKRVFPIFFLTHFSCLPSCACSMWRKALISSGKVNVVIMPTLSCMVKLVS